MRQIIFSFHAPPLRNPRAFRVAAMFKEPTEFTPVELITTRIRNFKEIHPQIHRIGWPFILDPQKRNQLKSLHWIRWLHQWLWPDDKIFFQWISLIYYLVRIRRKHDQILTVSHPFSSHIIGLILKKVFRHMWTVDMGDLFAFNSSRFPGANYRFEKWVLFTCDRILVNAPSMKEYLLNSYGLAENKILVKPNGCRLHFTHMPRSPHSHWVLSFFGNTYLPQREGCLELKTLSVLRKKAPFTNMEFHLFGIQHSGLQQLAEQESDWVKLKNCQTDEQLLVAYGSTDVLVNLSNLNYPGLPSKLEEYISSGLPIIHFCYDQYDPGSRYLKLSGSKVFIFELEKTPIELLHNFLLTVVSKK